jgi:hypothetical protein
MPLYGTFNRGRTRTNGDSSATDELYPTQFTPSNLESGIVVQRGANYGTEGGRPYYGWFGWRKLNDDTTHGDPHRPLVARVKPFPTRVFRMKTTALLSQPSNTAEVGFIPPSTASLPLRYSDYG